MDRNLRLSEKVAELEEDLARWAKAENILESHERISIILKVEPTDKASTEEFLRMNLWEFFTRKRFLEAGVRVETNLSRISKLWDWRRYINTPNPPSWADAWERNFPKIQTVKELVDLGSSWVLRNKRYFKIGNGMIEVLRKVLAHNGIDFE